MMATRPTVLKFGPIVLPHVNTISRGRGALADVGRTAGGLQRSDTVRVWRSWTVQGTCPTAAVEALEDYLDQIMWQADRFWVLDMGAEVDTMARIDPDSWSAELVLGRPDWSIVSFTVEEQ